MSKIPPFRSLRPWALLSVVLMLTSGLLVGCGMAGAASQIVSSAVVPMLLLASMVAFLVGCGGSDIANDDPPPPSPSPTPTPTPNTNKPAALKFLVQPNKANEASGQAFIPLTPAPQVAVVDKNGDIVNTSSALITIGLNTNPSGATLQGTLTKQAVKGIATFDDLRISRSATGYTLFASTSGLLPLTSAVFTVAPLPPSYNTSQSSRTDYPNGVPVAFSLTSQATGLLDLNLGSDIAYASSDNKVRVMLSDGNGGFKTPTVVASGFSAGDIVLVDLNNDGKRDLVVTDLSNSSVRVLLGNGDGTFSAAGNYAVGGQPAGLVAADFTGEGKLDVAVTLNASANGAVAALRGDGSGALAPAQYSGTNAAWGNLTALPNPGTPAINDLTLGGGDGKVHYLSSNGDGLFNPLGVTPVSANPIKSVVPLSTTSIVASDSTGAAWSMTYNSNGVYNTPSPLQVSPLSSTSINAGYDTSYGFIFSAMGLQAPIGGNAVVLSPLTAANPTLFPIAAGAAAANQTTARGAFVHMYGGLSTDIVFSVPGATSVLLNKSGSATFSEPPSQPTTVTNLTWSTMGLTVLSSVRGASTTPDLYTIGSAGQFGWQKSKNDGTFNNAVTTNIQAGANHLALGDVNVDGQQDVVITNGKGTSVDVLLGLVPGQFGAKQVSVGGPSNGVALSDLNKDRKLDMVVNVNNQLSVLLGNGDGTFKAPANIAAGSSSSVPVIGDVNSDGNLDIIEARYNDNVTQVVLGNGDGTFKASQNISSTQPTAVALGDFNGDGRIDLAVTRAPQTVTIYLGDGQGGFKALPDTDAAVSVTNPVATDVNGDGKLDLVMGSTQYSDVVLLLGNGDGTFQAPTLTGTNGPSIAPYVGDINGDFKPDYVTPNSQGSSVTVNLHK